MSTLEHFHPIFALATSLQNSALHLHRISGENIFACFAPYLQNSKSKKKIELEGIKKFPCVFYANLIDENANIIDDVVVTLFKGPQSYTGQDIIEISSHGNKLITQKIHSLLRYIGFHDAKPGEFTSRSVLFGKIDLSKAEAIHDLITAETFGALSLARDNLNGVLSDEILSLKEKLIECLSYLEAHIDFSTDEVGEYDAKSFLPVCQQIENKLKILQKSYSRGLVVKEGVKVVLCGKPNVGKSTLFNSLLQTERAIVTDIAGTTRDILSERFRIDDRDFLLLDTAGLRKTQDVVESIGIERTKKTMSEAHVVCLLLDSSFSIEEIKNQIFEVQENILTSAKHLVLVFTKQDLTNKEKIETLKNNFAQNNICFTSMQDTDEFQNVLIQIYDLLTSKQTNIHEPTLLSSRQKDKVDSAFTYLSQAKLLLAQNDLPEKCASLLNSTIVSLEEIIGEFDLDMVYEKIFSSFCIGK